MTVQVKILAIILLSAVQLFGQEKLTVEQKYELEYQKRIKKEYLNRVYIPADLAEAFIQLNGLIDAESKKKFLSIDEQQAARKLHFSLGRWMMHNWGFYEGSRLSHYLKGLGITYPDDMARFIIITYHRNLSKTKLEVKALIDGFVEMREAEFQEKLKESEVIHQESRIVPKPDSIRQH